MHRPWTVLASLFVCGLVSAPSRGGQQLQGQQLQGQQLQGQQLQGASVTGQPVPAETPIIHRYDGWFSGYQRLGKAQIVAGELRVPEANGRILSGSSLAGTWIPADQGGRQVWTLIREVRQDPTFPEGGTFLYSIEILAADGTRSPLCRVDTNGVAAAIPVAAVFDEGGNRIESSTQFTFGCTAGVVAKCYRWGYRPWLVGAASVKEFAQLHWACTRMARADYCGDGQSWTQEGTLINLWDRAPAPGPFNDHGSPPPQFLFEAGWSAQGAVCLSKQRWLTLPPELASRCPDRLIPPGAATGAGTVCDTEGETVQFDATTQLFNESQLNH